MFFIFFIFSVVFGGSKSVSIEWRTFFLKKNEKINTKHELTSKRNGLAMTPSLYLLFLIRSSPLSLFFFFVFDVFVTLFAFSAFFLLSFFTFKITYFTLNKHKRTNAFIEK